MANLLLRSGVRLLLRTGVRLELRATAVCTVSFNVKIGNTAVQGATCKARLVGQDEARSEVLFSNREVSATTDASWDASLSLIKKSHIISGTGVYQIWVEVSGNTIASIRTTIPDQASVQFHDLIKD